MTDLELEVSGESSGTCDCCGNTSKTVWGYLHSPKRTLAAYFVQWTVNAPQHPPNFDFLFGTWGDDKVHDKRLASFAFRSSPEGGSFVAIDSASRPSARSAMCTRALTRDEVVNNPELMEMLTSLIDTVWLNDPRIADIKYVGNDA